MPKSPNLSSLGLEDGNNVQQEPVSGVVKYVDRGMFLGLEGPTPEQPSVGRAGSSESKGLE